MVPTTIRGLTIHPRENHAARVILGLSQTTSEADRTNATASLQELPSIYEP